MKSTHPSIISGSQPEDSATNRMAYPKAANTKAITYANLIIELLPSFLKRPTHNS
jgi:hypothetical protein